MLIFMNLYFNEAFLIEDFDENILIQYDTKKIPWLETPREVFNNKLVRVSLQTRMWPAYFF